MKITLVLFLFFILVHITNAFPFSDWGKGLLDNKSKNRNANFENDFSEDKGSGVKSDDDEDDNDDNDNDSGEHIKHISEHKKIPPKQHIPERQHVSESQQKPVIPQKPESPQIPKSQDDSSSGGFLSYLIGLYNSVKDLFAKYFGPDSTLTKVFSFLKENKETINSYL